MEEYGDPVREAHNDVLLLPAGGAIAGVGR
jgi:hypothetical protein